MMSWGKVNKHNTLMQQSPYMLNVPHALAMAHDKNLICVADRENGRVLCYNMDGQIARIMQPKEFGSTIYSIAYCDAKGNIVYSVHYIMSHTIECKIYGFIIPLKLKHPNIKFQKVVIYMQSEDQNKCFLEKRLRDTFWTSTMENYFLHSMETGLVFKDPMMWQFHLMELKYMLLNLISSSDLRISFGDWHTVSLIWILIP